MRPDCFTCKYSEQNPYSVYRKCNKVLEDVGGLSGLAKVVLYREKSANDITLRHICDTSLKFMGLSIQEQAFENLWCFYPLEYNPLHLQGQCKKYAKEELTFEPPTS